MLAACAALAVAVLVVSGGGGKPPSGPDAASSALLDAGTFAAGSTPILMYHAISAPPPDAATPELFVDPEDFAAEMAWLDGEGFEAITLDQLVAGWRGKSTPPPKPVVVSFDDGLQSQYTDALPVMRGLGWSGVLNLKLESLDQGELTEAMVGRMIAAGWEVDSHTISHADVTALDSKSLQHEVGDSRRILQRRFDVPVNFFCYPSGRFDDAAVEAVRKAGYSGATTTIPGLATAESNPYELDRIRVNGSDGVLGLAAKLAAQTATDSG